MEYEALGRRPVTPIPALVEQPSSCPDYTRLAAGSGRVTLGGGLNKATRGYSMNTRFVLTAAIAALASTQAWSQEAHPDMSFFITSEGPGNGADLGGLEGADEHCTQLAEAVGAGDKTWRAYLSTTASEGEPAVNARDRIGEGPWHNAMGVVVAESVEDLHSEDNNLGKETSLSEKGEQINGRGDTPNMHDIITGSQADGTVSAAGNTCGNWTSSASDGSTEVGHHDRQGGGADPTSWNAAHGSRGCGQADLQGTGGNGLFYCFAID